MKEIKEHNATKLVPQLRFKEFHVDWNEMLLDNFAQRGSGHTPSKSHPEYYNGNINWISLTDSKRLDRGFIEETNTKITQQGIDNSSAVLHPSGTVLLSRDAGVGKSAVMKHEMAVSQHFIVWSTEDGKSSNWFLYNWLQIMKPHFERIAVGNTIKTIGLPYFKKLKIVCPDYPEQQKIAAFLSAVDKKIEQLTKKKELLEQYKKGSLQQLFSGQIRFKDENGKPYPDWEETKLVECILRNEKSKIQVNEISGNVKNKENKFPFFTSGEKVFYSDNYLIENENIFMSTGGKATVQFFKGRCSYSTDTFSFSSNSDNSTGFIFYFLENIILKIENQYFYGSGLKHLDKKGIMKYKLLAPSQPEQQKIARYLSSIDTKIESVNNQITQTQTFKKGLLQQLFI